MSGDRKSLVSLRVGAFSILFFCVRDNLYNNKNMYFVRNEKSLYLYIFVFEKIDYFQYDAREVHKLFLEILSEFTII